MEITLDAEKNLHNENFQFCFDNKNYAETSQKNDAYKKSPLSE